MKTNQFFNTKRFVKYTKYSIISNYRQTLLFWGAIGFAILAISLLSMWRIHSSWNNEGWITLFLLGFYATGLLNSGFAFKAFRSKERTISELLIPVSTFERFVYEFITKIIAFLLLYPTIFYATSSIAVIFRNAIPTQNSLATVNGLTTYPFNTISFEQLSGNLEPGLFGMLLMLSILVFILALAGSASFRKLPLVKTIVFVGLILLTGIGYLYLMLEKLHLRHPWVESLEHNLSAQQGFLIGKLTFASIAVIALIFTYFKIKEKEAS